MSTTPQNQDWFAANAPSTQLTPTAQDWFASNAPQITPKLSLYEQARQSYERRKNLPEPQRTQSKLDNSFEGHPENIAEYVPATVGRAAEGVTDISRGNVAMGTHKIIQSGMNALAPMTPIMVAGAPVMAARAAAGGYIGSKATGTIAEGAGATPDQKALAEDLGNIAGGFSAASGLPRALFESAAKAAMNKVATSASGALDPDIVGLISPRLAHLMRVAGKVAEVTKATTEGTAAGPVPAGEAPTPAQTPEYKLPNATYLRPDARSLSQQPPTAAKPNLLAGIREHEFLLKVQDELNRQGGDEQAQKEIDDWIEAHNQQAPGAKPQSAADVAKAKFNAIRAAAESKANAVSGEDEPRVPTSDQDMQDLLMKSIQSVKARKASKAGD